MKIIWVDIHKSDLLIFRKSSMQEKKLHLNSITFCWFSFVFTLWFLIMKHQENEKKNEKTLA